MARSPNLQKVKTVNNFGGGWNVADSELNLDTRYARELDNMYRGIDGSLSLRYGTRLFKDVTGTVTGDIVSMTYFSNNIVVVTSTGQVCSVDSVGTATKLWDSTIAGSLPGAPAGWSTTTFVSTTVFGGELILCNGVDKPLLIHSLTNGADHIVNGTFDTVTTSWAALNTATLSVVSAKLKVLNGAPAFGTAEQEVDVIPYTTYYVSCDFDRNSSVSKVYLRVGTASGLTDVVNESSTAATGTLSKYFQTAGTSVFVQVAIENENGKYSYFDNVVLEKASVTYLYDQGTGSNANTPIGAFCTTVNQYVIIAGNPTLPATIWISNQGTSGTWEGDAGSDGISVDLSKYTSTTNAELTGISSFRGQLVCSFNDVSVVGTLGIYDTAVHVPTFNEVIDGLGTVAHKSMLSLGYDLFMCDNIGVPSLTRTVYNQAIRPVRVSQLIDPAIQTRLLLLSDLALRNHVFSVYNTKDSQYMMFVPNKDPYTEYTLGANPLTSGTIGTGVITVTETAHGLVTGESVTISGAVAVDGITAPQINTTFTVTVLTDDTYSIITEGTASSGGVVGGGSAVIVNKLISETEVFVYTNIPQLKVTAWALFSGWNFSCGCRSGQGRLFFANGSKIYIYGTAEDAIYGDLINDSAIVDPTNGNDIVFRYAMPWFDLDHRMLNKNLRYIQLSTEGTATFTVRGYVDYITEDADGADAPTNSVTFVGGDSGGYGQGDQPYGGGRRTATERNWAWTSKLRTAKLVFSGSTTAQFKLIGISLVYLLGSIIR